jgi:acylphosphatase
MVERETAMRLRARVTIKGIVQRVNYRYFTMEKALQHNVTGWVRNLANSDGEACFEGDRRMWGPDRLVPYRPSPSQVDEVVVESEPFKESLLNSASVIRLSVDLQVHAFADFGLSTADLQGFC